VVPEGRAERKRRGPSRAGLYSFEGKYYNPQLALEHVRAAAANGDPIAESQLGSMYAMGKHVEKDIPRACKLLRSAAGKGEMDAQRKLGVMLVVGEDVPEDRVGAVKFLQMAAAQGDLQAKLLLVVMHAENGLHSEQIAGYCQEVAKAGFAAAQYILAVNYLSGNGGFPCNHALGRAWLEKAAAQDYANAKQLLKELPPPHQALSCRQCLADNAPLKCGRCRFARYASIWPAWGV
jgi:TPR repeat protein